MMKMRLIDAAGIRIKPEFMYDICGMAMIRVEDIVRIINEQPTIQPKRGKWINDRCSVCGYGVMPWNNTPYCHNCGADMRGEQDG